jgi:hypothetical protein
VFKTDYKEVFETAENMVVSLALVICIIKLAAVSQHTWPDVGVICALALILTPHAYFRKKHNENCHSTSHNKKMIESLTTSLNLLSLKVRESEKLSQQVAKAQGFSNLNRKYTL